MMAAADSSYYHELTNGLIARGATSADTERIAHLMGLVWWQRAEDPSNPRPVAAGYSGKLAINFYRGGLRLLFEQGYLTSAEPWQAVPFGPAADASCPELIFLRLLFGHRSLTELRTIFPDVSANDKATTLINALFPARPSWVYQL